MTESAPAQASSTRPYVVGVTGGIGSGKTTVCDRFNDRHAVPVIDADIAAREVVEPGEPALDALVAEFSTAILDAGQRLDRRKLKSIVFADERRRKALEAILHPAIGRRMAAQVSAVTTPYCLMCIPLLAEGRSRDDLDRVLVVDCPESVQVARVTARDDLTEQEVAAIMQTQASREQRLAIADDVIVNDGNAEALDQQVDSLHAKYLKNAAP